MTGRKAVSPGLAFTVAGIGIATYSCMDAFIKGLSIASGVYNAVMWRSIGGILLTGALFIAQRKPWPNRDALKLHALRGAAGGISVILFFWGLVRVPMAQSVALTFLAPLIALYLAAILLGESIRRTAIGGSIIASIGVFVIAWGQANSGASDATLLGSGAIILASLFYACSLILLRQQAQLADPLEVTLFTSLVMVGLLALAAPWLLHMPSTAQVGPVLASAALGSVSALMLAWAYRHAEAQVLAPVEYTAFVWAAILGFLVFGERVSFFTVAGAALIIVGCLAAVRGSKAAPAPQTEVAL